MTFWVSKRPHFDVGSQNAGLLYMFVGKSIYTERITYNYLFRVDVSYIMDTFILNNNLLIVMYI